MTEEMRGNTETEVGPSDSGGTIKRPGIGYVLPVSMFLVVGGAVLLLAMILKRVKERLLWLIPLVMWFAGIGVAMRPWEKFLAGMQRTEEEIVTTLDELDPVADA